MLPGISSGCSSLVGAGVVVSGGGTFTDPNSLLPVAWYDPSDASTMFQDAAGTIPAAIGDPVGRINDKSAHSYHLLVDGSGANRPTRQAGYLDFNGTTGKMAVAFGAPIAQPTFISVGIKLYGLTTQTIFDNFSAGSANRQNIHQDAGNFNMYATSVVAIGSSSTAATVVSANFNGSSSVGYLGTVAGSSGNPGTVGADGLRIGSNNGGVAFVGGRYSQLVFLDRTPTSTERANLIAYMTGKLA